MAKLVERPGFPLKEFLGFAQDFGRADLWREFFEHAQFVKPLPIAGEIGPSEATVAQELRDFVAIV